MQIKVTDRKVAEAPIKPDKATGKAPPDWTGSVAPDRAFFINLWIFRYGTSDKAHGAAVLLSVLLLVVIVLVMLLGPQFDIPGMWLDRVFTWLGSAFLFVAGVAVGRSGGADNDTKS